MLQDHVHSETVSQSLHHSLPRGWACCGDRARVQGRPQTPAEGGSGPPWTGALAALTVHVAELELCLASQRLGSFPFGVSEPRAVR